MKRIVLGLLNRPLLVAVISIVIAGGVGWYVHKQTTLAPTVHYVKATAGTIAVGGDTGTTQAHLTLGFLTGGKIAGVGVNVGDTVHKGDTLATLDPGNTQGALTQAKAALAAAKASYDKLINGASGTSIDVAKAAVHTARVAYDQTKTQQQLAVQQAYTDLLNVAPAAYSSDPTNVEDTPPTISGSYTLGKSGSIIIHTYSSSALSGLSFNATGLATTTGSALAVTPQALGNSGLYVQFPSDAKPNRTWIITLPNTKAAGYIAALNAYQTAQQRETQALATAQAKLDQANANLAVVVAKARPEDVAAAAAKVESAQGALQIAESAYQNTLITAPTDGTVTAVHITAGQLATPSAPAIEIAQHVTEHKVSVMVPNSALVVRDGKTYVREMTENGVQAVAVTTGAQDSHNTEITSGLTAGSMVALQD